MYVTIPLATRTPDMLIHVRRDSEPALTLVKLATDNGLDILGTRLEAWDRGDLLWPEEVPDERKVEYLRLLVRLTGPRKSRDRAALIMAVHGCPCERLRSALSWGPVDSSLDSTLTGGDEDEIARVIEDTTDDYMSSPLGSSTFPRTTTDALSSVLNARAKSAARNLAVDETDREAGAPADPPRQVGRRFVIQVMHALADGEMFDPGVVGAFTGLDSGQVAILADALTTMPLEVDHLVQTMPLSELATICRVTRMTLTPDQLPPQSARLTDDDLAAIAARKAPGDYIVMRHHLRTFAEQCGLKTSLADAGIRDVYGLPISDKDRANLGLLAPSFLPTEDDELSA